MQRPAPLRICKAFCDIIVVMCEMFLGIVMKFEALLLMIAVAFGTPALANVL